MYKSSNVWLLSSDFLDAFGYGNWESGCIGNCASYFIDHEIKGDREEVIRQIKDITGEISTDNFDFNSCDEQGRIDISLQENENGERLTEKEWDKFKSGEINTYLATYTFQFYQLNTFSF